MKIGVATCTHCGTILTSRANHDFNTCKCGTISVDGGYWDKQEEMHTFYKMCFTVKEDYTFSTIELDISSSDLYHDWNQRRDVYKYLNKHLGA